MRVMADTGDTSGALSMLKRVSCTASVARTRCMEWLLMGMLRKRKVEEKSRFDECTAG